MNRIHCLIAISWILFLGVTARGEDKMVKAEDVIKKLNLQPLADEGGFFRQTYQSAGTQPLATNSGFQAESPRCSSTAIYYLVTPDAFSALHRLKNDEIFHFYSGDPVEMIQITEKGEISRIILGSNIIDGEVPQVVVKRGVWQGTKLKEGGKWGLLGTTMSPGFEYEDFELGKRELLLDRFPNLSDDIVKYTREEKLEAAK